MEQNIFNKDFPTQIEAIEKMNSFGYGIIKESKYNWSSFVFPETRDTSSDLCFQSENNEGFYFFIIENHSNFFRLLVDRTNKHKMITGAIVGDLEMLIDNFANTDNMKGFALEKAIENGNWNIVDYIIDKYGIKDNLLWSAIRYNNVEILWKLFDKGYKLPKDWLAYCMYNDSITVTRQLLYGAKAHLKSPMSEIKTNWFNREVQKDKETSNFVRKFLDIPKSPSLDEILKKMKL